MSKAAASPTNDETNPMVVIDTGMGTYYMRLSAATIVIQQLACAQRLEYSWSDRTYKFVKTDGRENGISVKTLTPAQLAQLYLETDAE